MSEHSRRSKIDYSKVMAIQDDASVRELLKPIARWFKEEGVTEVVINDPGLICVERYGVWEWVECPEMTYEHCYSLAIAVASYTENGISEENTILSARLPGDERIQVIVPPTVPKGTVSITIRVPSKTTRTMDEYERDGFFENVAIQPKEIADGLSRVDRELLRIYNENRIREFLTRCVVDRKTIAVIGDTGSGKTTFMKTLCQLIPVRDRLITIEDVRELFLPNHPNKVHLTYSTQGVATVTPTMLIKSTMRMKPDRVLLAELRGAEAFDFIDLLTTGHEGSLTSFHATNCSLAFARLANMCRQNEFARAYPHDELLDVFAMTIDVIVHVKRQEQPDGTFKRFISEIYFDPQRKMQAAGR